MTATHATHETPMKAPVPSEQDWFDQYLTFVKRIEAPVVRTTARVASRVAEYVPERPAFLASMPKVHEVMSTGITVRKRMVDEQTRFARQMMKAMDPMLVRVDTVHVRHDDVEPKPANREATTTRDQQHDRSPKAAGRRPVRRTEHAPAARAG
jgi:hypothetical protein